MSRRNPPTNKVAITNLMFLDDVADLFGGTLMTPALLAFVFLAAIMQTS